MRPKSGLSSSSLPPPLPPPKGMKERLARGEGDASGPRALGCFDLETDAVTENCWEDASKGVGEALVERVPLRVGSPLCVDEGETEDEPDELGVGETVPVSDVVAVPLRVCVTDDDGDTEGVGVSVGVSVGEGVGVELCDDVSVVVMLDVLDADRVVEGVAPADRVVVGVLDRLLVDESVVECVGVADALLVVVSEVVDDLVCVEDVEDVAVGEGVPVPVPVTDAVEEAVLLLDVEDDCVPD